MPTKAEKLLSKGRSLESKGKRDKALELYRDACRNEPYDPDLWSARSHLARSMGHRQEATDALFKVCELYMRGGLPTQALTMVKQLLELDPSHGGAKRLRRVLEEKFEVAAEEAAAAAAPAPKALAPTPAPTPAPDPAPAPAAAAPEPAPAEPEPDAPIDTAAATDSAGTTSPFVEDEAGTTSPVIEVEQVEPSVPLLAPPPLNTGASGGVAREFGLTSIDSALDSISLVERLGASGQTGATGAEILLEEEGRIDVVQAIASTLTTSPLLSELDSDLVRHLIDCGKLVHKGEEEIVFKQGDLGTSLYLILAGEVSVQWEAKNHSERRELARLRPGAFFGEMALLTNTGRSATVVALRNSDFLEISRKSVRELIDREPRVLKLLMRFFRARLVGTLLQTSALFKPFARDERRQLITRFRLRELGADQTVIREGERTDGLFIVLVGKLEVLQALKNSRKGKEHATADGLSVLLGTLSSGDVFGEMSLLDGSTAIASVRTRTRAWVLLLPTADYEDVVARHPQIKEHLAKVASERRERNQAATAISASYKEERLEPV